MRQPPFRPRAQFAEAAREYRRETERTPPPLPPRWEIAVDRPNGSRPLIKVVEGQRSKASVELTRASTLKAEPVDWLWRGWLARGKAHILGGQPGAGKTTLAMHMASTATTGGQWPALFARKCDCDRAEATLIGLAGIKKSGTRRG